MKRPAATSFVRANVDPARKPSMNRCKSSSLPSPMASTPHAPPFSNLFAAFSNSAPGADEIKSNSPPAETRRPSLSLSPPVPLSTAGVAFIDVSGVSNVPNASSLASPFIVVIGVANAPNPSSSPSDPDVSPAALSVASSAPTSPSLSSTMSHPRALDAR